MHGRRFPLPGALRGRIPRTLTRAQAVTLCAVIVPAGVFAIEAYQRRWMSDDGLIALRQGRQLLAGQGFSYSAHVRDESGTSVLWAWLLTFLYAITPGDPADWAVALGLVLSVAALVTGMDASRRLLRRLGVDGALVPVGVLVVLALPPFWDFATSGLETSLSFFWLAIAWRLLVEFPPDADRRRQLTAFGVLGLGTLVRPEFGIATVVFCGGAWLIVRPGPRRTLLLAVAALGLPVVYEVFRAGYYGALVPSAAVAKEAGKTDWSRGLKYLEDFTKPYVLWIPVIAIFAALLLTFRRLATTKSHYIILGAPILAGELLAVYVIAVGGDYMHGRMWLPPLFLLLLPVFLLPVTTWGLRALAAVFACWAVSTLATSRLPYHGTQYGPAPLYVTDERSWEVVAFGNAHPIGSENHAESTAKLDLLKQALAGRQHVLLFDTSNGPRTVPLAADRPESIVVSSGNMGIAAVMVPADGGVSDINGIVSPLSAHLVMTYRVRAGHEKLLPLAWALAEYGDPAAVDAQDWGSDAPKADILAARHVLTCGRVKELLDATQSPLTPSRFWDNLVGAPARTSLRIPPDPVAAEKEFCR